MRVGSEVPNRKTEVFGWGSWTVWSKKRGEQGGGEWGRGGLDCPLFEFRNLRVGIGI